MKKLITNKILEEIKLEFIKGKSIREIAESLNLSTCTVRKKLIKLNLIEVKKTLFSKEEEDFIEKNYFSMSAKEIGKKLGRTEEAIKSKSRKLGLYKTEKRKVREKVPLWQWMGFNG